MPSSFTLTIDTVAPAGAVFTLNAGMPVTSTATGVPITLTTTDPDTTGYMVKIWGDLNPTVDEASALWVPYGSVSTVTLSSGDGLKTLHARIRDDVGNPTAVQDATVTLNTSVPTLTITVGPDKTRLSDKANFNQSTFTWQATEALTEWSIRVVGSAGADHTSGVELGHAVEAVPANTGKTYVINTADLLTASPGDGPKVIKVFGKSTANGNWSI